MSQRGKSIYDVAAAMAFVALATVIVGRPRRPGPEDAVFWATLQARCNAIAYKEVHGSPQERQEARELLDELLERASRARPLI